MLRVVTRWVVTRRVVAGKVVAGGVNVVPVVIR